MAKRTRTMVGRLAAAAVVIAFHSLAGRVQAAESLDPPFRRGDANGDGIVDEADARLILTFVEGGNIAPIALDAADADDDGAVTFEDGLAILDFVQGLRVLPAPGPFECGLDPTPDGLSSAGYPPDRCIVDRCSSPDGGCAPVANVVVHEFEDGGLAVVWENPAPAPHGLISVVVGGRLAAAADEAATGVLVPPAETLSAVVDVCVVNGSNVPACVEVLSRSVAFLRGDANGTGEIDISDAIFTLVRLFASGEPFPCADAADTNDDGAVDLSDAVQSLVFVFLGGRAPTAPFPGCGRDPTLDGLTCDFPTPPPNCPEIGCKCEKHELLGVKIWNDLTFTKKNGKQLDVKLGFWVESQLTCKKSEDEKKNCQGTVSCSVTSKWTDPAARAPVDPTNVDQPKDVVVYNKCTGLAGSLNLSRFVYKATVPMDAAGKANGTMEVTVTLKCGDDDKNPTTRTSKLVIKDSAIDRDASDRDGDGKDGAKEKAAGTSDETYDP